MLRIFTTLCLIATLATTALATVRVDENGTKKGYVKNLNFLTGSVTKNGITADIGGVNSENDITWGDGTADTLTWTFDCLTSDPTLVITPTAFTIDIPLNIGTNYIDFGEIATPASPADNFGRMYAKDNGGVAEPYWLDKDGTETNILTSGTGAPIGSTYITQSSDATLTAERTLTGGTSITLVDGGANSTMTLNVDDDFLKLGGDVATAGTYDFGSANVVLEIPNAAAPTTDATGEIAVDTDLITQGMLQVYLASAIANVVATTDTPGDNEVPTYDAGTGTISWEAAAGGGVTGTGTTNYISKWDSATSLTDSLIFNDASNIVLNEASADVDTRIESDNLANAFFVEGSTGNIGVGTNAPDWKFHTAETNTYNVVAYDTYDDGATYCDIQLRKSDTDTIGTKTQTDSGDVLGQFIFRGVNSSSAFANGARMRVQQSGASGASFLPAKMIFSTWTNAAENTEQLCLDDDGGVGIGTSSPAGTLDVVKAGTFTIVDFDCYSATNTDYPVVQLRKSDSDTLLTLAQTDDNDILGRLDFKGVDNGNARAQGARIEVIQDGASGAGEVPTEMIFSTWSSTAENANQLYLDSDGDIGIKTADPEFNLVVSDGATGSGVIAILEDTDAGTNNATFKVPALAADTDYTLPPDDGDAGEQLQTDGSGVLTWESAGSGGDFSNGGDAGGANRTLGNTDAYDLGFLTNNVNMVNIEADGDLVFNETSIASADIRIESNTDANFLFIDGQASEIGLSTSTPACELDMNKSNGALDLWLNTYDDSNTSKSILRFVKSGSDTIGTLVETADGEDLGQYQCMGVTTGSALGFGAMFRFVQDGSAGATYVPTDLLMFSYSSTAQNTDQLVLDGPTGNVGIGISDPTCQLHVDQSSSSAAVPVLLLDQADIDEAFTNYVGTSAADSSRSISSDTTEDAAKFGAIRIQINGTDKWIRVYDDAS